MKLPLFSRLSSLFFVGCAVSALGLVACGDDDADAGAGPSGEASKGGASGKAGAAGKAGSGGKASAGTGGSSAGTGGSSGSGGTAGTGGSAGQSTGGVAGTSGSAGAAGANAGSAGNGGGAAGNGGNAGTNTAGNAGANAGGSAGTNAGGNAGASAGGSAGNGGSSAGGTGGAAGTAAGGSAGSAGAPNDGVTRYHVSCLLKVAGADPAKAIRFVGVRNLSSPATVSVTLTPLVVGATKLSQTTGNAIEGIGNVISPTSAILNFGNDFIVPANANPVNGVEAELDNVTMPVALVSPSYACGELQGAISKPTPLSLAGAGDRCLFDLVDGGPDAAITAVADISRFTAPCP